MSTDVSTASIGLFCTNYTEPAVAPKSPAVQSDVPLSPEALSSTPPNASSPDDGCDDIRDNQKPSEAIAIESPASRVSTRTAPRFTTSLRTGQQTELQLLPHLQHAEDKQRLTNQLRLARWIVPAYLRPVDRLELDATPPRIHYASVAQPAQELLPALTVAQRFELAAQIMDAMERAGRAGLVHGDLDWHALKSNPAGRLQIDFLTRFCFESEDTDEPSDEATDRSAAIAIVSSIVMPLTHQPELQTLLNGQQRGQLRSLLSQTVDQENAWELFDRWHQLLWPFCPRQQIADASASRPSDHVDSQAASIAQAPKSDAAIANDAADRTCIEEVLATGLDDIAVSFAEDTTASMDAPPAVTPNLSSGLELGSTLGRYRLTRRLGEGGMGVVYQAIDLSNEQSVAVKVLRSHGQSLTQAIRRFHKEARLLAKVQNQNVTRLLHSGHDQGVHYLVMEFVDGTNLKQWIQSHGPLTEAQALHVIGEVARALADAHRQGVIHRDIKPENVLLGRLTTNDHEIASDSIHAYQVKLSDFGIARTLTQTESMEMTQAGTMLGTPLYMSPEQCKGLSNLTPASDIYSLGITLYLLLTGQAPFESDDPMRLAALHCFEPPASVQRRNPLVSDATSALVQKMLAKQPQERVADALQLVREVEKLLGGESDAFELHPRPRAKNEGHVWEQVLSWDLASKASDLWPLVSNTERLNRAAGLPSVQYRTQKDADGALRKFGSFRLAGLEIEWEEHPFEWIEGSRMGVLREFTRGPFEWFKSVVELNPRAEGGTTLTHTVQIQTRNPLGRVIAQLEAGWKGRRALDRIYRRIDQSLQQEQHNPLHDPFESTEHLHRLGQQRLEQRFERMLEQGVDFEYAEKLIEYLRTAPAQSLAQIRPLAVAERLGLDPDRWLDTCLVAAHVDLLKLRWDVLCPTCRVAAAGASQLAVIKQHTHCVACDYEFQSNAANAIELVFQVHPEIRTADDGQYCIGGPEHSPHVVSQVRLEPGERLELVMPLSIGQYLIRMTRSTRNQRLTVGHDFAPSHLELRLGQLGIDNTPAVVRAGQVCVAVCNDQPTTQIVRVERAVNRSQAVTAATASALPRFRSLFPDQVFSRDNPITAENMTLVATRLVSCDHIYRDHSDAEAYQIIQSGLERMEEAIQLHHGAVIKVIGELLIASFNDTADAVRAGLELHQQFLDGEPSQPRLPIATAIHRGPLLVTNQNGRLDYFGATTRDVQSLCQQTDSGLVLTDTVFSDSAVISILPNAFTPHPTDSNNHYVCSEVLLGNSKRLIQHLSREE